MERLEIIHGPIGYILSDLDPLYQAHYRSKGQSRFLRITVFKIVAQNRDKNNM